MTEVPVDVVLDRGLRPQTPQGRKGDEGWTVVPDPSLSVPSPVSSGHTYYYTNLSRGCKCFRNDVCDVNTPAYNSTTAYTNRLTDLTCLDTPVSFPERTLTGLDPEDGVGDLTFPGDPGLGPRTRRQSSQGSVRGSNRRLGGVTPHRPVTHTPSPVLENGVASVCIPKRGHTTACTRYSLDRTHFRNGV